MKSKIMFTVILFCLAFSNSIAQWRIGDVSVPDSLINEYLFDCYAKTDTVWGATDPLSRNIISIIQSAPPFACGVGLCDTSYTVAIIVSPRHPSERDFLKWMFRKKNND